jgi:hypothetical protein
MPERGHPPDIRNWSTLSWRVRIGFFVEVIAFVGVGSLLGVGVLTIASAAILLAASIISLVLLFDSRRAWWPDEPTVPVDPLATHGGRWIALAVIAIIMTVALVAVGALH